MKDWRVFQRTNGNNLFSLMTTCATCAKCVLHGQPFPFPKIKKVIDRLHLCNHKGKNCKKEFTAEPLKEIHPALNTMVPEQTFVWASRFKKILNAMPMRRFPFIITGWWCIGIATRLIATRRRNYRTYPSKSEVA